MRILALIIGILMLAVFFGGGISGLVLIFGVKSVLDLLGALAFLTMAIWMIIIGSKRSDQ